MILIFLIIDLRNEMKRIFFLIVISMNLFFYEQSRIGKCFLISIFFYVILVRVVSCEMFIQGLRADSASIRIKVEENTFGSDVLTKK